MVLGYRFIVLLSTTFCLSLIFGNIVLLNFTKNCMRAQFQSNSTFNSCDVTFDWNDSHESMLLSANAWGAAVFALPASWSFHRFGVRRVFIGFGYISGLVTCLMPFAAFLESQSAFYVLLIGRILQGVSLGSCFPALAAVITHWAPINENGLFVGVLTGFIQISPFLTNPVAGLFCGCTVQTGWTMTYWIFGVFTLTLFILWLFLYRDDPKENSWAKATEVDIINNGKVKHEKKGPVPVKAMVTSLPVIALLMATLPNMMTMQMLILYIPTYLKYALHFDPAKSGFFAAIPTLVQFFIKVSAGLGSDKVTCCSETIKVKVFNTIALGGAAAFLTTLGFIGTGHASIAVLLLISATGILGFHSGGFLKSATLVARQYSTFIMACMQMAICLSLAVEPFIVAEFIPSDQLTNEESWRNVFVLHAVLLVVGNSVFCFFGSGEAANWTKMSTQNVADLDKKKNEAVDTMETYL